jgi:hypothetical protein
VSGKSHGENKVTVNKEGSYRFQVERFNLKKLNDVRGKEKYHVEVSNKFASLESLDTEVDISNA